MQFHALIAHFVSKGFKVISFDAPGHGKSSGGETNLVEFAACIDKIVAINGAPKVLIGHSLGAVISLLAHMNFNYKDESLCLIDPVIFSKQLFDTLQ